MSFSFDPTDGLDYLGAEPEPSKKPMTWVRGAIAFGAGVLSAVFVPKHPVLAFLGGAAAASNAHAVYQKDRSFKDAVKRMGRHVVATVGSLSVPKHPALGYVAGAVAADMLIDGEGGGVIEEWAHHYDGLRAKPKENVLDAEFTDVQPTALVKT